MTNPLPNSSVQASQPVTSRVLFVLTILSYSILIGVAFVLLLAFGARSAALLYASLTCSMGAMVCGALTGFLFGIPATLPSNGNSPRYRGSTSLEQVADWLTKIILGVTLTQLMNVPSALQSVGSFVERRVDVDWAAPAIVGLLLYFGVLGFLLAYIYTRIEYTIIQIESDWALEKASAKRLSKVEDRVKQMAQHLQPTIAGIQQQPSDEQRAQGVPDDPNKGEFGGSPQANGKQLSATVSLVTVGWYRIRLQVVSTDPAKPLTGNVKFDLHPTFKDRVVSVPVQNGTAQLDRLAYGAFTVGAETDDATKLELDLSELDGAPQAFKDA